MDPKVRQIDGDKLLMEMKKSVEDMLELKIKAIKVGNNQF